MIVYDKNIFGSNREIDSNGYLRVDSCNITKTQVAPYLGREIPGWKDMGLDAEKIYYVLRPEDELRKAVPTFNNLPLTREHIEVDVENVPKDKIVGSLGDHAEYADGYLKNNLIVYDQKDIDLIMSGKKKELSCGYRYTPVREHGTFNGQDYDFVMKNIIGNHVALVKEGRAGHDVVVSDTIDKVKEKFMNLFRRKEIVNDEFKENEHPRAENGQFKSKGGEGSKMGEEVTVGQRVSGLKDSLKSQLSKEIASDPKKLRELAKNGEQVNKLAEVTNMGQGHLKNALNEMADELDGKGSEKKEESKETAVEKMYKKLSEQGMKGEALEQAIYEKHGWEGVEEARMISEYESGNPKHSQKEQEELVKSLEEQLGDYKKIVKNFEEQGETGLDYNHYKQMVERHEGALEQAKNQLDWIKRHTNNEESSKESKINFTKEDVLEFAKKLPEKGISKKDAEKLSDRELAMFVAAETRANADRSWADSIENAQLQMENGREEVIKRFFSKDPEGSLEEMVAKSIIGDAKLSESEQEKVGVVMKEFKDGELKSGSGEKVTDPKQAIAIALSEADKMAKDKDIPDEQEKPEKAGDKDALVKGEEEMTEEVKEALAEEKVKEVKEAKDTCAKDEGEEKDLKGKEKEAFAEGVDYGEKKEKEEPKKLDSEHESEGTKKADEEEAEKKKEAEDEDKKDKKEEKKEMAKDSAMAMDIDAIKQAVREEMKADFNARECARKAVRSVVGDVNVMSFDSAEDIYKFACEKAGMDLNDIVSYKDAFKGLTAGRSKLALDASPKCGSNEECFKNIRIA